MKVLVLGGRGFLGAAVCARLRERGDVVCAPSRSSLDLAAADALPDLGAWEAVLVLAQSRRDREWPDGAPDVAAVQVLGTVRALDLARRAGARRVLLASSGSVYGYADVPLREDAPLRGNSFYARTKRMAEELLPFYAEFFETLCLRPFALYGPGSDDRLVGRIAGAVARGAPVPLWPRRTAEPHPEGLVTSPCFVDDAADLVLALLNSGATGTVNLAGPEALSVRQIAECAAALLGRKVSFQQEAEQRAGDLVADLSRLRSCVDARFVPFGEGMRRVLSA
jgi:UDP-glucose 4-epimerase